MKNFPFSLEMTKLSQEIKSKSQTIAFVPTMGALHEGHLALFREGKRLGDFLIVSIFVNPKQFNDPEDFKKYTRDLEGDLAKCEQEGVDFVFTPEVSEIYPAGELNEKIPLPDVAKPLEGQFRPGHFEGVLDVVSRLFRIVQPDFAIFGMKDFQQVRVIEEMTKQQKFATEIIRYPTVREADGLAMSSRNSRLTPEGRKKALVLYRSLKAAQDLFSKGERDALQIQKSVLQELSQEPSLKIDYAEIVDNNSLEGISNIENQALVGLAVFIDGVRLIDNCLLS